MSRPETGPMQFGDDWPGLFLRGDYAGPRGFLLEQIANSLESGQPPRRYDIVQLRSLAKMLRSCEFRPDMELQAAQLVPDLPTLSTEGGVA